MMGAIAFLLLTIYVPYLRGLFLFESLDLNEWGMILVAELATVIGFKIFKKTVKIN